MSTPAGRSLIKDHAYWLTPAHAQEIVTRIEREAARMQVDHLRMTAARIDQDLPGEDALRVLDAILSAAES
jgi:hypothetical protein